MKNSDEVAIFWDYENCPAPTNSSGYNIVNNIRSVAQNFGSVKLFKAYLEVTEQASASRPVILRSELQLSGVSLTDCPHNGRKDVADKMIIVDMWAHAMDNPAPSTIILISGDRDFAYALALLRLRRYRVVLITLPNAHQSLRAQASTSFDWVSDVLEPTDPSLSTQPPSPRRGKMSAPPAEDTFCLASSSLFHESHHGKSASSVDSMSTFQDETKCKDIHSTPPKREARHDPSPPYLEAQLATSFMASNVSNNGTPAKVIQPEAPASIIHSPVTSCRTYVNGGVQTPSTTTACSSESNFSRTTLTSNTSAASTPKVATSGNVMLSSSAVHSPFRESAANSPYLGHGVSAVESTMQKLRAEMVELQEPSPFDQQASHPPEINATPNLSSANHSHSGLPLAYSEICRPANVTAPLTAPTSSSSSIPPSSSQGSVRASTIAQLSANPRRSPSSAVVPEKFKVLIKCLKSHRSRGYLKPIRSKVSSEIAETGTYRLAGVSTFGEYAALAEKEGIVELGGSESIPWISLMKPWYNVRLS